MDGQKTIDWIYVAEVFPYQYFVFAFAVVWLLTASCVLAACKQCKPINILFFKTAFKPILLSIPVIKINFGRILAIFSSPEKPKPIKKEKVENEEEVENSHHERKGSADNDSESKDSNPSENKKKEKGKNKKEEKTEEKKEEKKEEKPAFAPKKTIFNLKKEDWHIEAPKVEEPFFSTPFVAVYFTAFTFSIGEILIIYLYLFVALCFVANGLALAWFTYANVLANTKTLIFAAIMKVTNNLILYNLILVLLPMTRNNIWRFFFGTSFERALFYHKWIGFILIALVVGHGVAAFLWGVLDDSVGEGMFKGYYYIISLKNIPGLIAAAAFILLGLIGLKPVRRVLPRIIFILHPILAVFGMIVACIHSPWIILHLIPGVALWIIDLILRFWNCIQFRFTIVGAEQVVGEDWILLTLKQKTFIEPTPSINNENEQEENQEAIDDDEEILDNHRSTRNRSGKKKGKKAKKPRKPFKMPKCITTCWKNYSFYQFKAGQYGFVNIPKISMFGFYPLTMVSSPHDPEVQFLVKAPKSGGKRSFAGKLLNNLNHLVGMTAVIDGPYGHPSVHERKYENLVLISEGVGASAALSILKKKLEVAEWQRAAEDELEEFLEHEHELERQRENPSKPLMEAVGQTAIKIEDAETSAESKDSENPISLEAIEPNIPNHQGLVVDTSMNKTALRQNSIESPVFSPSDSHSHSSKNLLEDKKLSPQDKKRESKLKKRVGKAIKNPRRQRIVFVWSAEHPLVFMNYKDLLLAAAEQYPYLKVDLELYCAKEKKQYKGIEFVDKELMQQVNFNMTPNYTKILKDFMEKVHKNKDIAVFSYGESKSVLAAEAACYDSNPLIFPRLHFHGQKYSL